MFETFKEIILIAKELWGNKQNGLLGKLPPAPAPNHCAHVKLLMAIEENNCAQ